jgi:predicted amidohydrolase
LNVAAVQFKPDKSNIAASLDAVTDLAARAAAGSHLVVLPEMAVTGYIFPDERSARAVAERPDGPTFQAWRRVAREHRCWVVGGFPEVSDHGLYNSALVIDDRGELAFTYRKTMLYDADRPWARPGNSGYRRFETAGGSFGVGICMDLNDPRFVMWCWRSNLDAVAFPTNWIEEGVDVWPYWRHRIGGSGAALVAANTYGPEEGVQFSGRSAVLQGHEVLASAASSGDEVLRATLRVHASSQVAALR